ncbi:MAG: hypothetical protein K2X82_22245 [Gemmataceae bacterium]|nr:hypothetical protein [Gemmataceae bacterium]
MRRTVGFVAVACAALLLPACGTSPQSRIVGKWEADASGTKAGVEFTKDGKATMTLFGQSVAGTYRVNGDDLEMTVNGQTSTGKVKVTATELELTRDGMTVKYKKV